MGERIVIGARGSSLSLKSACLVLDKLRADFPDMEFEIKIIKTEGDRNQETPLHQFGYEGIFTKDIEKELLSGSIDMAVHSLKDLATRLPEGLTIGAVLERSDPRDTLLSRGNLKLDELPKGAIVGTDSPRRKAQLLAHRPDLSVASLRGNIETRIRKLDEEQYDAIVIAAAGLIPLDLEDRITQYFPVDFMMPAQGQAVVAVEVRKDDRKVLDIVKSLEHADTRIAVEAERAFVRRVGGGCKSPVAAHCRIVDESFVLEGMISNEEGTRIFRDSIDVVKESVNDSSIKLAELLLSKGAGEIIKNMEELPLHNKRILITRPKESAASLSKKLENLGALSLSLPAIRFVPAEDSASLNKAGEKLQDYDWIVFTSSNGVKFFLERLRKAGNESSLKGLKVAAVGPATAKCAEVYGIKVDYVPERYLTEALAEGMPDVEGKRILLARADIADGKLKERLEARGASVEEIAIYKTLSDGSDTSDIKKMLKRGYIDFVTFTSASTVRGLAKTLGEKYLQYLNKVKIACIGPVTAKAAKEMGLKAHVTAKEHTEDGLVKAIVEEARRGWEQ